MRGRADTARPSAAPVDGMGAMHRALLPYRLYFEFRGRSRRSEYWPFVLMWLTIAVGLNLVGEALGFEGRRLAGWLFWLSALGSLIPALAATVRRLHDVNCTGWWAALPSAPVVIVLVLLPFGEEAGESMSLWIGLSGLICPLVLAVMLGWKGNVGPNRFGADPRNPDADLEAVFS